MKTQTSKFISSAIVIVAFAPIIYGVPSVLETALSGGSSVLETAHTVNAVVKAAPAIVDAFDKYEKENRTREANARKDLLLTPYKVTPNSFGVRVLWQIENKSDREYRTATWDCTAFFNSVPVKTGLVMEHHVQANHLTYTEASFSYHDYDPSAESINPSAFRFECKMSTGLTYPDKNGH